jgi:Fe-S cluster assembly iron-binding protein IscA
VPYGIRAQTEPLRILRSSAHGTLVRMMRSGRPLRAPPDLRDTSHVLTLTPEAVRAVVDLVVAQGPSSGGLRIAPGPPSAAERTWDYAVVREPFEGDLVVNAGRARVFVDPDAAPHLEHAVLDARVDNDDTLKTRFVVRTG